MQTKLKICSICGRLSKLWQSVPPVGYCCKAVLFKPIPRFKPLTQTSDGKEAKPFKVGMAPVSKNRQAALAKYRRLRDKYFIDHPVCEFPGCTSRKITLHHKRGRIGAFLTDKRYFCSLCLPHHRWVEENPLEAKKMNLSDSRLDIAV